MKRIGLAALCLALPTFALAQEVPEEFKAVKKELPKIQKDLEKIRKKKFKFDVKAEYQSDADFRKYITKSMTEEYPQEKLRAQTRLLTRLGLIPKGTDLGKALSDLVASQALAYYEPSLDTFFVVKPDQKGTEFRVAVLHELQHAIQDQHFNLGELQKSFGDVSDDSQLAFRMLVEGEATYVMLIYQLELTGQAMGNPGRMLDMQFQMTNSLDREQLMQMQQQAMAMQGMKITEAQKKQMKQALETPRYLYRTLADPYQKGAYMVHEVFKKGGWKAVDALWATPPSSSEQALHPEKLIGKRDEPMVITLPDVSKVLGEGWSRVSENTLGEFGMRTVFREVVGDNQVNACAGWDGDKVEAYEQKDAKKTSIVWHTVWDSDKDAREFAIKYKGALIKKYGLESKKSKNGVVVFSKDGEEHLMALKGNNVLVVEGVAGGQAMKVMERVLKEAKVVEHKPLTFKANKAEAKPESKPETQRRAY